MAYTRNQAFETNDMSDGVVLFDPQRNIAHHLNGPAMLVWEVAEGRTFEEVARLVADILEVPGEEADAVARSAVEQLSVIHAVQG